MRNTILLGRGRQIIELPWEQWAKHLDEATEHGEARLSFMTEAHHQVRYFVVREMPYIGRPIKPTLISEELKLPMAEVNTILDDLEQNLFFLFRNQQGAVAWAYPVTVDETPHHLTFDTGEQLYAA